MRRLLALLVASLAVLATACGSVESPAASVGGRDISQASLRDELDDIEGSGAYRASLEEAYGPLPGDGTGTFSAPFVAQVLSVRIYYELLDRELDRRDIDVSEGERDDARAGLDAQIASLGEDGVFTARQRDRLVEQQAVVSAVRRAVAADPEEFFAENRDLFVRACVSHILIGNEERTDAEAKALAEDLQRQLGAGADFAALARQHSDDTGSGAAGGELGCEALSRYVDEFSAAAAAAPIGQVTAPVQSEFGYHLIRVASRTTPAYDEVRGDVAARMAQDEGTALDEFLIAVTCDDDVEITIDPQYGRWDRSACDDGGIASVVPPAGPRDARAG